MNGIVINIGPVILRIGGFALRWYGLAVFIAVVAAVLIAIRQAKSKEFSSDDVLSLLPWLLID